MDLWLAPHDVRVREPGVLGYGFFTSPFGDCVALASATHLLALRFTGHREGEPALLHSEWPHALLRHDPRTADLAARAFTHPHEIPVMAVGTPFQLTVWEFLRGTSTGATLTYGEVARAIGRPGAARAVGRAAGANRIALLIPCHRVVSGGKSGGKLTGYRWGITRKRDLLAWELSRRDPLEMPF